MNKRCNGSLINHCFQFRLCIRWIKRDFKERFSVLSAIVEGEGMLDEEGLGGGEIYFIAEKWEEGSLKFGELVDQCQGVTGGKSAHVI
jgi:hypothetical protein